jgi:AraC-like DNA-binding protein
MKWENYPGQLMSLPPSDPETFRSHLRPGELFEALFDAVPDAHYFVKDRHSRFVAVNRSFAKTFGFESPEGPVGKTDYDISASFLADLFVGDDRRVMETGRPLVNKVELVPTGDALDWLTTTKIPLFGEGGEVIGLAGVTRRTREDETLYRNHPEMHRIVDYVRGHFREKIALEDMARVAGVSPRSVGRLFQKTFGLTPIRYLKMTRLNAACRALRDTDLPLAEIARQSGFNDQTCMNRDFRSELNLTPKQYRERYGRGRNGRGAAVRAKPQAGGTGRNPARATNR